MEALSHRTIRRLPPATASRIAAGEVIERPLSAVKEVVENALDAGARAITIAVDRSLDIGFSVADDGAAIAADELALALERHATSKIESLEDLDRLRTLGFRGEALPSIAAVSRLTLTSRPVDAEAAAFIRAEGGAAVDSGRIARAPGTTVEVANLFFNTPARRKFLHSPAGELRAAVRMLECYGLAYPEVAFRLTVDGRERFAWPAAGETVDRTRPPEVGARRTRAGALWGPRHAEQLVDADGERDGVHVAALLGLPEHARATREGQVFLINRRWVQSPMLGQTLRRAYGDLLPHGRHPSAVLWVDIPAARLDVNVHPTKREVRFADESALFSLVAGTCAQALAHLERPFTIVPGGSGAGAGPGPWPDRVREGDPARGDVQTGLDLVGAEHAAEADARATAGEPELWQLHRTYILAPVRGGLVIVDQHAAHERVLYEEARARLEGQRGAAQQLLFPALVDLSPSQFDLALEVGPWLKQLGWDLAPLGPPTLVIHGAPSDMRDESPGRFLQDLLDGIGESAARLPHEDVSEHVARTYACHAAVRAGDALTQTEMRALVDRLFATSRPHGDPHGRQTYVRLDLDELHRRFGRT